MSSTTNSLSTAFVQEDWQNREFIEIVQINVMRLLQFLNEFDVTIRSKLGHLNEKLNKVERAIEYCEASLNTSTSELDD